MRKKILENDICTLFKTDDKKYTIVDKKGNLILGLEGEYTKEKLEEQLNNCGKGYVII